MASLGSSNQELSFFAPCVVCRNHNAEFRAYYVSTPLVNQLVTGLTYFYFGALAFDVFDQLFGLRSCPQQL